MTFHPARTSASEPLNNVDRRSDEASKIRDSSTGHHAEPSRPPPDDHHQSPRLKRQAQVCPRPGSQGPRRVVRMPAGGVELAEGARRVGHGRGGLSQGSAQGWTVGSLTSRRASGSTDGPTAVRITSPDHVTTCVGTAGRRLENTPPLPRSAPSPVSEASKPATTTNTSSTAPPPMTQRGLQPPAHTLTTTRTETEPSASSSSRTLSTCSTAQTPRLEHRSPLPTHPKVSLCSPKPEPARSGTPATHADRRSLTHFAIR